MNNTTQQAEKKFLELLSASDDEALIEAFMDWQYAQITEQSLQIK